MSIEAKLPSTLEAQYVAKTVGPALTKALVEIVEKRPVDPVEYLANFLYKFAENKSQQEMDLSTEKLVEKQRQEQEEEERRQEQMRQEAEELREREEEMRREHEAEERRKKELEELAKRKEELANVQPALPSLTEEEDQIVEFGETKLHALAATQGANLTKILKENHNLVAARNKEYKTPRDVAKENNLDDNVRQIDDFVGELVANENYKQLSDLVILGFDELLPIIEAKYGNAEQMREKGLEKQAEQIYNLIPNLKLLTLFKITLKEIKDHVEKNELNDLKQKLDKKSLALYRDSMGRTALHTAIIKKQLAMALFLAQRFPILNKLNDCAEKYPADYYGELDSETFNEEQATIFAELVQYLK